MKWQGVVVGFVFLVLTGCVTFTSNEKMLLRELETLGLARSVEPIKHPGLAGGLNFLPGFGNFYLAIGTYESDQWLFGFLNAAVWPVSILWAPFGAVVDANTLNKKEVIYYYLFDPKGKRMLEEKRRQVQ